jgi:hypothetical protein
MDARIACFPRGWAAGGRDGGEELRASVYDTVKNGRIAPARALL